MVDVRNQEVTEESSLLAPRSYRTAAGTTRQTQTTRARRWQEVRLVWIEIEVDRHGYALEIGVGRVGWVGTAMAAHGRSEEWRVWRPSSGIP